MREGAMLDRPNADALILPSQNTCDPRAFVTCENCGGAVLLRATGRPRVHAFCDRPECQRACSSARQWASRAGLRLRPIDPPMPNHVRTGGYRNNADLIAAAVRLHVPDGALVVDVTWGFGVFWKRFAGRPRRFTLIGSDIRKPPDIPPTVSLCADFRQLPFADESVDVVVLDPPYTHCGHYINNHRYGAALTDHLRHPQIMELYRAGMVEARRVLRPGGTLWVKCKDEFGDGKQNRSHITLHNIALVDLRLKDLELFTLRAKPPPTRRHQWQRHALKTESYLWVFKRGRGYA
jgi:hypothetical protein